MKGGDRMDWDNDGTDAAKPRMMPGMDGWAQWTRWAEEDVAMAEEGLEDYVAELKRIDEEGN